MLDLTSDEASASLRRIAEAVGHGARRCAWALATFADEHRAKVALVSPAHVESARASLAYVRASPLADHYSPRWLAAIANFEKLIAEKEPGTPEPPNDLTTFLLDRLGLERDPDPRVPSARKMGIRPTHVLVAKHRGGLPPKAIADAAAIVADVFPIGAAWVPTPVDVAFREAAGAIGKDLAYGTRLQPEAICEQRMRRFFDLFESDATFLSNGSRNGTSRSWSPLTLSTFDNGTAIVDRHRVGIVVRTGED